MSLILNTKDIAPEELEANSSNRIGTKHKFLFKREYDAELSSTRAEY